MAALPEGTLTFLLTDLVGSTQVWESAPAAMRNAMASHDRIVARCLARHHGIEVPSGRAGDSILAVFRSGADAASCAIALQQDFARERWPTGVKLEVRVALHTGEAELRQGQYYGIVLNRCARLLATCHGGQILLTSATEQLLVDELPPKAQLRDLGLHRLKDLTRPEHVFQLVDVEHPKEFPPLRSQTRRLSNLPLQPTAFIGRETELRELGELHRQARVLTLTGPGGAGKTRLALRLASDVVGDHVDGVWLIELDPVTDPLAVPQVIAGALGLKEQAGRGLADTLADYLRERHSLLVLDNCEHVVDSTARLAGGLLKECSGLRLLATSREPLKLPGEVNWRVPPLGPDEAVRLFADRARSHAPGFQLTDENLQIVIGICDRLDRIPLAIELAAARIAMMPVDEILNRLQDRFSLLTSGSRTAAGRQQTLKSTLDWSYELLAEPEKILFARVAIFAGRFSLEAAEAVCSDDRLESRDVLDLVARLVDKSMVTLDAGRYRCLETLRTYGREQLSASGEFGALETRLAAYLLGLAEAREPGRLAGWLDRLEAVHDDIRATLTWTLTADPDLGMRLANALHMFWLLRGHASEPRQFADSILRRTASDFRLRPAALHLAGAFAYVQGDFPAARIFLNHALTGARAISDRPTLLLALERAGLLAAAADEHAVSEATLKEALVLARELGDQASEASILHQLGLLATRTGDLVAARSLLEKSVGLRRTLGRSDEASMPLTFLAAVALLQLDVETARPSIVESLEIGRALGDRRAAWSLDVLAWLTALEGYPERAVQLAGAGSAMHETSGNRPPPAWVGSVTPPIDRAREELGDKAAQAAWEAGRRMSFDEALEFALGNVGVPNPVPASPS
jgi:predicted ATPase/class 3 adenylate cyclase